MKISCSLAGDIVNRLEFGMGLEKSSDEIVSGAIARMLESSYD